MFHLLVHKIVFLNGGRMVSRNLGRGTALVVPLEFVPISDPLEDHAVPMRVADPFLETVAAADAVRHWCTRTVGGLGVYPQ